MRAKDYKVVPTHSDNETEFEGTKLECIKYINGSKYFRFISSRKEYSEHLTNFRLIRRFIRVAKSYGYSLTILEKHQGSCYIGFSRIGKSLIEFSFRFSDHFLGQRNQIPAGVICEFTNLESCIRDLQYHYKYFNRMSKLEKEELYENRYNY